MDNTNPPLSQPASSPDRTPSPPVTTTAPSQPPQTPPATTPVPPKSNKMYFIIAGILCIGILSASILYLRSASPPEVEPVATVSPTAVPTPTPPPNISRIASTSAFAAFSEEIASFSAVLDTFTLQDSTLAPPIMDTDLGLSN